MICWGMRLQSCSISVISGSIVDAVILINHFRFARIIFQMLRKVIRDGLIGSRGRFYYYSDMKVKIDQGNYLIFNPQAGGRVIELKLQGRQIIQGKHSGLDNASYLMYPWVNRIEKVPFPVENPYNDGNGIPLHGLYVDSPRKVTIFTLSEESIGIEMTPEVKYPDIPEFTETFILSRGRLSQKIKVHNTNEHNIPFCFGYHPYLQIDQEEIKDLDLKTDIKMNIQLDPRLVTPYPFERKEIEVRATGTYDSLFEGGNYLQIANKEGFHVKISSGLPFWQIYTPPDGKRIAVEPMSFTGNLYQISEKGYSPSLSEGCLEISAWQQK